MSAVESVLRISHATEYELDRKLIVIMQRRGFIVTKASEERISVGELARRVGRKLPNVSQRLRSPHCPDFLHGRGARKIGWIVPNERLLSYLRNNTAGHRSDLATQTPEQAERKIMKNQHRFIITVGTSGNRKDAELALLVAFAKRDPDGCEFHLRKSKPPEIPKLAQVTYLQA